jgi:hypothetical protein
MKFLGKSELRRLCKGGASGRTGWKGNPRSVWVLKTA